MYILGTGDVLSGRVTFSTTLLSATVIIFPILVQAMVSISLFWLKGKRMNKPFYEKFV